MVVPIKFPEDTASKTPSAPELSPNHASSTFSTEDGICLKLGYDQYSVFVRGSVLYDGCLANYLRRYITDFKLGGTFALPHISKEQFEILIRYVISFF